MDFFCLPSHTLFCCFFIDLGPVTVRAPFGCKFAESDVFCWVLCTVSLSLFHRWCRCIFAGVRRAGVSVDGSDPCLLISQSGEQGLKLHNNLSSSGGSVYLTKSSRGVGFILCFVVFVVFFLVSLQDYYFFFHFNSQHSLFLFVLTL